MVGAALDAIARPGGTVPLASAISNSELRAQLDAHSFRSRRQPKHQQGLRLVTRQQPRQILVDRAVNSLVWKICGTIITSANTGRRSRDSRLTSITVGLTGPPPEIGQSR